MRYRSLIAAVGAMLVMTFAACSNENKTADTDTAGTTAESQTTETVATVATDSTAMAASALSAEDQEFVNKAAIGGLAEVQLGSLASQKATNADVKAFGQRMVTDHGKANDELTQLATAKGITLPTELDSEKKAAMDHLNSLSGAEFDKAYMQHMVADHDKDVSEFEKASTSAQDPDVKGWAAKTLPTLQDHQKQAKEVAGKLK